MSPEIPNPSTFAPWGEARARNISVNAENAIHHDDAARSLGFAGGLVSGVTVFAYLMGALVRRFGPESLERAVGRVAFPAPVYDGEGVALEGQGADLAAGVQMRARRGADTAAVLEWARPEPFPELPPPLAPLEDAGERPPFAWERLEPGMRFRGFVWRPAPADQIEWCDGVAEDQALFREGAAPPVHPGLVLQQANNTVTRQFRMSPWIHVSSRLTWLRPVRVGETVAVGANLRETWEKGGHRYGLLDVTLSESGETLLALAHKVIFQPRGVSAP